MGGKQNHGEAKWHHRFHEGALSTVGIWVRRIQSVLGHFLPLAGGRMPAPAFLLGKGAKDPTKSHHPNRRD